ncbi:amidohydrolase family protein, partial [Flavobacteriaceae bacterium]|nr:amidohydrolase family protein [Flavobacteriaceae bacterium]
MKRTYLTPLFIAIILLFGCKNDKQGEFQLENISQLPSTYVIKNVNVIPMTVPNTVIQNANVVIRNKKILSINDSIPINAEIIDGTGRWLIPGLIDMHVHNLADINFSSTYPTKGATLFTDTQDLMLLYISNGVTTVFELSGRAEHFGQRNEIISGKVIGPRIAIAFLLDGGNSGNFANTPSDGRQTVRLAKAQGYEFIKVYSQLNVDTFKAIIDEANKQDMKVIGHIPTDFKGSTQKAFVPHFGMVAHAEEFSKQTDDFTIEKAKLFAQMSKENGTWLTPNLSNLVRISEQSRTLDSIRNLQSFKYVHPLMQSKWISSNQYNKGTSPERVAYFDSLVDYHIKLVKEFKNAGVPMVVGTDSGTSGIVWGFSIHDELKLLVDAGLTSNEVLISATRLPAEWLEIDDKIGTVETGKFADLILLEENPLENINNTKKISGVFFNGNWIGKEEIDELLSTLA